MSEIQTILGFVFVASGILLCSSGWPLYKVTVATSGFLTGGGIVILVGDYLVIQPSNASSERDWTILLMALVAGILVAWLALELINVLAFLFGFVYSATGTALVMTWQEVGQGIVLPVALVMGLIGGGLAIIAQQFAVMLGTAIVGALLITLGVQQLSLISADELALTMFLALAVAGFCLQYVDRTSDTPVS